MTSPDSQPSKTYSSEEIQQILQTAMAYETERPFSRTQLEEMAADLNISPDLLTKAEATWQQELAQRQAAEALKQKQRQHYRHQVGSYVAVNTGLILLNLATCGTVSWAIYPLLGWGLGLCFGPCKSPKNSKLQTA